MKNISPGPQEHVTTCCSDHQNMDRAPGVVHSSNATAVLQPESAEHRGSTAMQPQGVVTEDFSWGPAHPTQDEEAAGIPSIKQSSTSTTILSDDDKFADRIFKYIESKGHACDMHTIGAKVPKPAETQMRLKQFLESRPDTFLLSDKNKQGLVEVDIKHHDGMHTSTIENNDQCAEGTAAMTFFQGHRADITEFLLNHGSLLDILETLEKQQIDPGSGGSGVDVRTLYGFITQNSGKKVKVDLRTAEKKGVIMRKQGSKTIHRAAAKATSIFVGNIPVDVPEGEVRKKFRTYGTIKEFIQMRPGKISGDKAFRITFSNEVTRMVDLMRESPGDPSRV